MNWIRKLLCEQLDPILRNQFIIQEQISSMGENLEALTTILKSLDAAVQRIEKGESAETERALASSRGSWPRMKKHFEESDVRKALSQQADRHAAQLEEYWKNKAQGE